MSEKHKTHFIPNPTPYCQTCPFYKVKQTYSDPSSSDRVSCYFEPIAKEISTPRPACHNHPEYVAWISNIKLGILTTERE